MQTETIFYVIFAGIIALLLALFQYIYKSQKKSGFRLYLVLFRFLALFSLLLLLINPKYDQITYYEVKPKLVVAVDNSESISFLKQDAKSAELIQQLKSHSVLNTHFDLEFYQFGKDVTTLDSLSFQETQTNLTPVFKQFSEVYRQTTAPVILITDGNQTYGNDYEFEAERYKQPVFTVIAGDTIQYTDLKIEQLNVNKYVYLNNKFPVEIIATYNGKQSVMTTLSVVSGNKTIFSQRLSFSKNQSSRVININLSANSAGVNTYKAILAPLSDEKNIINNAKNFAVEVIDQRSKVAVVSDIVHPDLGALKKAIESNKIREANILKPEEFLNSSIDYQQVILYQPNSTFTTVFEFLKQKKTNVFTVLGAKTDWTFFNGQQDPIKQKITHQTEDFQGVSHSGYTMFALDDINFNEFPPLSTEFGEMNFSVPIDVLLYKSINGISLKSPLLFSYELENQRTVVLNGEGIWRWRAQTYLKEESFLEFDNFIGKLLQYLDNKQQRNRLNVYYDSFYNGNDHILILAQLFDKTYVFDNTGKLELQLTNKETNEKQILPFVINKNNYEVDLSGHAAGAYDFIVTSNRDKIQKQGSFTILEYNVEQQFLNANVDKLQRVAENTSGKSYFINNTASLIDDLVTDSRFATVQKSVKNVVPLISWKFLLAIIICSLSAEWFIRKYNGLT